MIARAFGQDVETKIWREASNHFMGRGHDEGIPSLEPARTARRKLVKDSRYKQAAALDKIVCGGAWFHGRGAVGQQINRKCHRCGQPQTAWHALWSCPHLKNHEAAVVKRTQWMKEALFEETYAGAECLWARAIQPVGIGRHPKHEKYAEDVRQYKTSNFDEMAWSCKVSATDGSGGSEHIPKELRKVTAAVALLETRQEPCSLSRWML